MYRFIYMEMKRVLEKWNNKCFQWMMTRLAIKLCQKNFLFNIPNTATVIRQTYQMEFTNTTQTNNQ